MSVCNVLIGIELYATGQKLWPNRNSNPGPFVDRANTH